MASRGGCCRSSPIHLADPRHCRLIIGLAGLTRGLSTLFATDPPHQPHAGDLDAVVLTDMDVVGAAGLDFLCFGLPDLLIKTGQAWVGILDRRELLVRQSRYAA